MFGDADTHDSNEYRAHRSKLGEVRYGAGKNALQRLLAIPSHWAVAAIVPLGKPVKQLTKLRRKPVEELAVRERADGDPFTG